MTLDTFNQICAEFPGAAHVVQWGGAQVWKVGGRIFAIATGHAPVRISFKARPAALEMMLESGDFCPAPYLAKAGWVATLPEAHLTDENLGAYLVAAHAEIMANLPKKHQIKMTRT